MTLHKSTRYALYAAMQMAMAGDQRTVTVGDVASKYHVPLGALAKVFQRLVHSGIATGTRGVGGGYRLTRPASRVTVLDIVTIFEPPRGPGRCLLADGPNPCEQITSCRLGRLFDEVERQATNTFASVSLETLVK